MYALLMLLACVLPADGSVIFLQDGFLVNPIMRNTGSPIVHTAIVLYDEDKPYVYEATVPVVRRMPLDAYYRLLDDKSGKPFNIKRGFKWYVVQPCIPYTSQQLTSMKQYARSQLGRPYMLRGWWKNREVKGIFCSQYVGNCIEKSGRIVSANFKESPGSLFKKLKGLYK
jgi:hypothetical protein